MKKFIEAFKTFRNLGSEWVDEYICRKYPFIMYKDIYGRLVVDIPYKEKKTCGCEGYNIVRSSLILKCIEAVE